MTTDVLVVGAGFAGVWAAAAAAASGALSVTVVSPLDDLVIRPRLYQSSPARALAPLDPVFGPIGVHRIAATVTGIDAVAQRVAYTTTDGRVGSLGYRRLVLASGSQAALPHIEGSSRLYNVDTYAAAARLDAHLRADGPTAGPSTVVVVGGGFTGIEVAAELVTRLRDHTPGRPARVVLVEADDVIGPALGPGPRTVITAALDELGVEVRLGRRLAAVTASAAVMTDGSSVDTTTVIWTAGLTASPLTVQIPAPRDGLGRLYVDEFLRVVDVPAVFVAGDTAAAVCPDGQPVLQSCQHAIPLGKFAGHNAAADLLGHAGAPFDPGPYITCLDLGAAGAVVTTGWQREVRLTGTPAKALKKAIVESYIYPPPDDPAAVLAIARARTHPSTPFLS